VKRRQAVESIPEMRQHLPDAATSSGIPNFKWINRNLPIVEVARKLGLRFGEGRHIHCWHPDRHHNADRTPSVAIQLVTNKIKCFGSGCGIGPLGPIDSVIDVLGCGSPAEAAAWLAKHFDVPTIPKGKHLNEPPRRIVMAGFEGAIGLLVQSGIWARLSEATKAIVPVMHHFGEREEGSTTYRLKMSYRAISRYGGIKSHNAIIKAIRELEEIHWLERLPSKSNSAIQPVRVYRLTPESDELMEAANAMAKQMRGEIETEREIRAQKKEERRRQLAQQKKKAASVYY
jgi:DNA-binding HxlR family transcriptional regulator